MVSFLVKCPDCGNQIARGNVCGNCGSCKLICPGVDVLAVAAEFEIRQKRHNRNYAIYMSLTLLSAFLAMGSSVTWLRLLFGNISALLFIVALSLLAVAVGTASYFANRMFPIELFCPACDARVDEVGLDGSQCPACHIPLR